MLYLDYTHPVFSLSSSSNDDLGIHSFKVSFHLEDYSSVEQKSNSFDLTVTSPCETTTLSMDQPADLMTRVGIPVTWVYDDITIAYIQDNPSREGICGRTQFGKMYDPTTN
jgi:hypothetical protein